MNQLAPFGLSLGQELSFTVAAVTTVIDLAAITMALVRRRGFTSTLAWICGILALPGVGAVAYFLLANPRVLRTNQIKRAARTRVRVSRSSHPETRGARGDVTVR